ncbi:MAG: NADH-quinone oxidoreductase subunit N [Deltaproteobacteria bacterium]|nr:NADH-quinone oxidoreductase subunit N [Deltaproteobacteria bacterium]
MKDMLLYLLPIVILAVGGFSLMLVDAFQKEEGGLAIPTAMLHFASGAACLALWNYAGSPADLARAASAFNGWLAFDRTTLFLDLIIALGGGLASLLAGSYLNEHKLERGEFYTLITFASAGCMMLAGATDLIMVFIGLETMSLGVYAMTAFRRTNARSQEGALKYFLLGSFAAALLLYGSALLYGMTGHTDLAGIRAALAAPLDVPGLAAQEGGALALSVQQTVRDRVVILAMVLVIAGLAFKIGAVPFHMWVPDAYEGAPTPATAYMAVTVKAAAFGAMLRVLVGVFGDTTGAASLAGGWPGLLAWLAVASMVIGNLVALSQSSIKRMLAYSSIAHGGYILAAFVVTPRAELLPGGEGTVGQSAAASVLFYLLAYAVSNIGAFGALMLAGSRGKEAVSYDDVAGLGKRHPAVALALSFFILSLAGIPPMVGFFAKYNVIRSALEANYTWLAIALMVNSAIGVYYYLRVLVKMYMHDPAPGATRAEPMVSPGIWLTLIFTAVLVLVMGAMPQTFFGYALEAVKLAVAPVAAAATP